MCTKGTIDKDELLDSDLISCLTMRTARSMKNEGAYHDSGKILGEVFNVFNVGFGARWKGFSFLLEALANSRVSIAKRMEVTNFSWSVAILRRVQLI